MTQSNARNCARRDLVSWVLLLLLPLGSPAEAQQPTSSAQESVAEHAASWEEVDRLVAEEKIQEAAEQVGLLRASAREESDDESLARALITEVQLHTGLYGYPAAVRLLRQERWPESPRFRAIVELYYGQSLFFFAFYGRGMGDREPAVGSGEDLELWTQDQIMAEANNAFGRVWSERDSWGSEPLGALAPYFEGSDFPARVRGTLRDSIAYLWVANLGIRRRWSQVQVKETRELDLDALLARESSLDDVSLRLPDLHPLRRIAAILEDLEAWHRHEGRREAAFEALGSQNERSSVGMAQLARFLRLNLSDEPYSYVEAREMALAGSRAHPKSFGGGALRRHCSGHRGT